MSLYKEFSDLLPYLQSVRKLKEYFSFDVMFPTTWKLPKKYVDENRLVEQESKMSTQRFFSFVSEINEEDVERITTNIKNIVRYNLDREEKEKLFEDKVIELKTIFEKQTLKSLKNLKFQIKPINHIELEDNEESVKTSEMVGDTSEEG
jgi:hypothetical protein